MSIGDMERQRILNAAHKFHYHPNLDGKRLLSGKSGPVGLVPCQSPEQICADAFVAQVLLGVEQAAVQHGFEVLLKPTDLNEAGGYTSLIQENHGDGILVSGRGPDDRALIFLYEEGVPVIPSGQLPQTEMQFVDVTRAND